MAITQALPNSFKKQLLDFYITSNFGSFFPRITQYTKSKIFKYTLSCFGFFSLYDALQFKDDINYFDIFDSLNPLNHPSKVLLTMKELFHPSLLNLISYKNLKITLY